MSNPSGDFDFPSLILFSSRKAQKQIAERQRSAGFFASELEILSQAQITTF